MACGRTGAKTAAFNRDYNMRAGKYHGMYSAWHENGQKQYECTYRNGEKHGPDNAWSADGELLWSRSYNNGELVE